MEDKKLSAELEAVYVAVSSQLEELKDYDDKAVVIMNLIRCLTMEETAEQLIRKGIPKEAYVRSDILITGMQHLCNEFADQIRKMPPTMNAFIHEQSGCPGCSVCRGPREQYVYQSTLGQPSDASKRAVEQLIATMTGGKQPGN